MRATKLASWLGGLVGLAASLPSQPSHAQGWAAAMQALPARSVVQAGNNEVDSATYRQTAALRAHLFRQAAPILRRRGQYFWQEDSTKWVDGQLYRIPTANCQYMIIGLDDLLDGFMFTLTPTGDIIDAYQVADFEPEYWLYDKRLRTAEGRFSYTKASKFTCAGFQTVQDDCRLNQHHKIIATKRTVTEYRITAAGKIQRVVRRPVPKH
jgi:hypothetical protein